MGMYNFMMSCGHQAKREVADPAKYYNIDREYYRKQGLCDKCWDRLRADKEKLNEPITKEAREYIEAAVLTKFEESGDLDYDAVKDVADEELPF